MNSQAAFAEAKRFIPGGVNSPVRAFRSVGGEPFFVEKAVGARIWDIDGNELIDYVGTWGPAILGHAPEVVLRAVQETAPRGVSFGAPHLLEIEMARLICEWVPSIEKVRMVNSGTEATMSALRLARGFTGRDKIVKFEGCYHGHGDAFLVQAGSGVATLGLPNSPGVPDPLASLTLTAPYNDLAAVEELFRVHGERIAAVILEPVVGNAGFIPPVDGFLEGLRRITRDYGALLIFDEVMTGFRVALGGAQADVVLSDMAPNISGISVADQARSIHLCELAVDFAVNHLRPEGVLLMKAFQGAGFPELLAGLRRRFRSVASRKPDASRGRSSEMYLLARGPRQSA